MSSYSSISSEKLSRLIGTANAPTLVDLRIDEDFAADPSLVPGAIRRSHLDIQDWAGGLKGRSVVVIGQKGQKLSEGAAAWLRHGNIAAEILDGGHVAWKQARLPTVPADKIPRRDGRGHTVWVTRERPIDSRPTEVPAWLDHNPRPPAQDVWIKANGVLPDDPLLQVCIVAYASDLTILDTAMLPHGSAFSDGEFQVASLDHAMWFHRPFRADEWLLYHQRSQSASHARGIAEGSIFTRDGRLVVTVMQEGLMRPNVAG